MQEAAVPEGSVAFFVFALQKQKKAGSGEQGAGSREQGAGSKGQGACRRA